MKLLDSAYRKRKSYFYKMINGKALEKELEKDETTEEKEKKFEKKFAKFMGVKHASLFGSGNHALITGLEMSKLEKESDILIQAFTCKQVPRIISTIYNSQLADIDESYNIDLSKAQVLTGKKTKAIQAIYSYGKAINSKKIQEFCKKNELILIEDCAHSLGAKNGKKAGSIGEFSIFSLRKNLPVGSGGVLCTSNNEFYDEILREKEDSSRKFGIKKKLLEKPIVFFRKNFPHAGAPYVFLSKLGYGKEEMNKELLDRFEISLATHSLTILPEIINKTVANSKLLMDELGTEKFIFPREEKKEINVYTRVPIFFKRPNKAVEKIWWKLQQEGFETGLFYKTDFEITAGGKKENFLFSVKAAEHMVPVGVQGLDEKQIIELAERIKSFSK
ncbi:MAG: aminotransferase class I/II-fold pyridoxal phosphate-dependent enzyme [Candidatus Diapherotrites archaeon]|nr:aminotransferase class I/II-fold pyridoxal phosphate-dependent enzyme [Candidatus Diapherotrites archaeon]